MMMEQTATTSPDPELDEAVEAEVNGDMLETPPHLVDVIIPTWNNEAYLRPCLETFWQTVPLQLAHVWVVNNGAPDSCSWITAPNTTILEVGENLGWEGGLEIGLRYATAPAVLFLNDDVHFPPSSNGWLERLLGHFEDERVGAVGPLSNMVVGAQNMFLTHLHPLTEARFLIGFCMLVWREALDEVGGISHGLPGGDDFDLSLRLRNAGYLMVADRREFVYHHAYKTGERVHGPSSIPGGWNSKSQTDATVAALVERYGQATWDHLFAFPDEYVPLILEDEADEGAFDAATGMDMDMDMDADEQESSAG